MRAHHAGRACDLWTRLVHACALTRLTAPSSSETRRPRGLASLGDLVSRAANKYVWGWNLVSDLATTTPRSARKAKGDGHLRRAEILEAAERIFVADGYPGTQALLRAAGYTLEPLAMSEFAKMDGGLSCLSLRF